MGIFGVLALLQNYKFILWGCSAIKLSAEYCPPRENLLPFISVCVCVCSALWFGHDIYVGYYCHAESCWLTDINCTFFSFFLWLTAFERSLCPANTQEFLCWCRHIWTGKMHGPHSYPIFPPPCPWDSLSQWASSRFNPLHGSKTTSDGCSLHKIYVCVCAWSHRRSILRLVC